MHLASTNRARRPMSCLTAVLVGLLGPMLLSTLTTPASAARDDTGSMDTAWVRVGHFVPGMDTTTIELQPVDGAADAVSLGDAGYGDITSYEKLAPGSYTAVVRAASTPTSTAPLLSRSFEITAGEARTVAVVGTSDQPRLAFLADDLAPPAPGTARVRLLSASEATGSVAVRAVDGPSIADGAVLGQATPYTTVPAGTWTLELTGDDIATQMLDVTITSGSIYTLVALDAPDAGVDLQVVTDAAGAVVAPRGGARTGEGGAAGEAYRSVDQQVAWWPLAALVALAAAAALTVRRRSEVGR